MSSSIDFVEYVCEQICGAGEISYKKMFGDYGIYCNSKIIGLICDNQFFLKETIAGKSLLNEIIELAPYPGAKPHFIIDTIDDKEYLSALVQATYNELPEPKLKKDVNR